MLETTPTPITIVETDFPQKQYLNLTYSIPEEQYEAAYTALAFEDHIGITEGLDEISICYILNSDSLIEEKTKCICKLFTDFNITFKILNKNIITEKNWNKEWEDSINPVYINKSLVITPSWKHETVNAPLKLIINPQMSFGSGHHETTHQMAAFVQEYTQQGTMWIDAGTGTGVLAILAVYCGAKHVFAFDNDEWSVLNTKENIERNVSLPQNSITIKQADVFTVELPKAQGIAANLHKNLIKPNLLRFYDALTPIPPHPAHLLVSGILRYDVEDVIADAVKIGFRHKETRTKGDWVALHFCKDKDSDGNIQH
ncbi:MAG: 50S ribosomal protein L11 methyltransferase [Candidatus Kapaibacterium sp.]|nr:MAG: 50S ribosomal protein L11 methyltransferase [Candidatus Kapabacteria bacterium]